MDSFTRLNPSVYLRIPLKSTQNGLTDSRTTPPPPTTILFFAWMGALPRHYAKFLTYYTKVYPEARIVLVLNNFSDIFYRSYTAQQTNLDPVVKTILDDSDGRLLVYALSNGGANTFSNLLVKYRQSTGRVLPVQAIVLDSAPGSASIRLGMNAMKHSLPMNPILKFPAFLLTLALLAIFQFIHQLFSLEDFIARARRLLNDPQTTTLEASRCYIYSKTDQLIDWEDVESHSHDAENLGYKVTKTLFSGSEHVAHMRTDSEKYWNTVQSLWKSTNAEKYRA